MVDQAKMGIKRCRAIRKIILFWRDISTSSLRGATATKQSMAPQADRWIASLRSQ
jgi:hypothetical protein